MKKTASIPKSKTLNDNFIEGVLFYTFPSFEKLNFLRHGFSTRIGGVSKGVFSTMNLAFNRGDDESCVKKNFSLLNNAVGLDYKNVVLSAQTHDKNIYKVTEKDRGNGVFKKRPYDHIDGLMTDEKDLGLTTFYADCVPLFFADPVNKVVATSHSGWKGTALRIGKETVQKMTEEYGSNPKDIIAGIAPSVGPCCFEVDYPVYKVFHKMEEGNDISIPKKDTPDKYMVDLWEINRRILLSAGIPAKNITVTDLCTKCHSDIFWSHRACGEDRGTSGAIISII